MRGAPICYIVLSIAACSRSEKSEPKSQEPLVPESKLTGTLPRHMRNCPSAVTSAQTSVNTTPDGVEVTITSTDPEAAKEIIQLTRVQARLPDPFWFFGPHSGLHGGPGSLGRCPIIHANTRLSYNELADGVRIHVAARAPGAVAQLQEATKARVRALEKPSS